LTAHEISSRPRDDDSAPCLIALVVSSCSANPIAWLASASRLTSGPRTFNCVLERSIKGASRNSISSRKELHANRHATAGHSRPRGREGGHGIDFENPFDRCCCAMIGLLSIARWSAGSWIDVRVPAEEIVACEPTNLTIRFHDAVLGRERILLVRHGMIFGKQLSIFGVHRLKKLVRLPTDLPQTIW